MNSLIASLLLMSVQVAPVTAQSKPAAQERVERFYEPKYLGGDRANRVINLLTQLGKARLIWDSVLKTVWIQGSPQDVAEIEALLKRFDVPEAEAPRHQLRLTIHMVEGSPDPSRNAPLPPELEAVVKQMKDTFSYKGFRLFDTILMHGVARLTGILPGIPTGTNENYFYELGCKGIRFSQDGKNAEILGFGFQVKVPVSPGAKEFGVSGISTDLTIREGQKLVLGKIKLDKTENAVFLVLSAKID